MNPTQSRHTAEPWMVGGDMAMKHTHCTQIVGMLDDGGDRTPFIIGSFNYNFLDIAIVNCVRAVSCVNALAGIQDPAAFVKAAREAIDLYENGYPESDHAAAVMNKLREHLGESNAA